MARFKVGFYSASCSLVRPSIQSGQVASASRIRGLSLTSSATLLLRSPCSILRRRRRRRLCSRANEDDFLHLCPLERCAGLSSSPSSSSSSSISIVVTNHFSFPCFHFFSRPSFVCRRRVDHHFSEIESTKRRRRRLLKGERKKSKKEFASRPEK